MHFLSLSNIFGSRQGRCLGSSPQKILSPQLAGGATFYLSTGGVDLHLGEGLAVPSPGILLDYVIDEERLRHVYPNERYKMGI